MICFASTTLPSDLTTPLSISHRKQFHVKEVKRMISVTKFLDRTSLSARISMRMESTVSLTSGASGRVNALISLRALRSIVTLLSGFFLLLVFPFRRQRKCRVSCSASSDKSKEEKPKKAPILWFAAARRNSAAVSGDRDTRRAMAIRRVRKDGDCRSMREFSLFDTRRGDTLFTQSWTPVSGEIKGLVVLLHGLNEHSGRYNRFAKQLNANGYKVYGIDWIGHGGSDWLHGYVHSLNDAVSDTKSFIWKVLAENPGVPCFCFGHSTGGAIVLKAALDPKIEALIEGIVLTSPAIRVQPSHPIFLVLAPIFSALLPKYQFGGANKRGMPVSRDPDALVAKYSDPLVYTGSIRIRTGSEILRISSYLQQNLSKVSVPFLVLHGTADTLTEPEASRKLYEEASTTEKSIKLYDGLVHDLLFEPEKEIIANDILNWLNSRLEVRDLEQRVK